MRPNETRRRGAPGLPPSPRVTMASIARSMLAPDIASGMPSASGAFARTEAPSVSAAQRHCVAPASASGLHAANRAPVLCVAIHDVAPATWSDCLVLLDAVRAVAPRLSLTFLVVPRYHGSAPPAPAMEAALSQLLAEGHELALHGYTHLDSGLRRSGLRDHLVRRMYTTGEGEFAAIDEMEALLRLDLGLSWFAARGWPVQGFVPPAWLTSSGARAAVRKRPFSYTTSMTHFHVLGSVRGAREARGGGGMDGMRVPEGPGYIGGMDGMNDVGRMKDVSPMSHINNINYTNHIGVRRGAEGATYTRDTSRLETATGAGRVTGMAGTYMAADTVSFSDLANRPAGADLTRPGGVAVARSLYAPSLMYTARSAPGRLLSPPIVDALASSWSAHPLLRLALHPADARHPRLVLHSQRLLEKLLAQRVPMTKGQFAAYFAATDGLGDTG